MQFFGYRGALELRFSTESIRVHSQAHLVVLFSFSTTTRSIPGNGDHHREILGVTMMGHPALVTASLVRGSALPGAWTAHPCRSVTLPCHTGTPQQCQRALGRYTSTAAARRISHALISGQEVIGMGRHIQRNGASYGIHTLGQDRGRQLIPNWRKLESRLKLSAETYLCSAWTIILCLVIACHGYCRMCQTVRANQPPLLSTSATTP